MKAKYIAWLLLFSLLTGCRSSQITSSWKKENMFPKKFDKILVLGLIREQDRNLRGQMEEHMAADLRDAGYNAVSSEGEFGPKAFENMDEETAIQKLQYCDVNAVITIVLLNKAIESNYYPHRQIPYGTHHNSFGQYYNTMYDHIYSPGYYVTTTKYFWESNFYEVESRELVYSVHTQSFNPTSAGSLANEYGKMIVRDILKNNILTPIAHSDPGIKTKAF